MSQRIPMIMRILACACLLMLASLCVLAQSNVPPVSNPCQRFNAGSTVHQPPALFSQNGVLNVQFSYQTTTDSVGRQLYCFMTPSGLQNPTLHVNPGDTLNITVTNNTPFSEVGDTDEMFNSPTCGDVEFEKAAPATSPQGFTMSGGSMNIHYHGTNTTPQCHGDNVVKTLVNPGHTFQYSLQFPTNEPPGLYWYHPHVHGLAELALLGGASGALVVDGIENVQPAVQRLRQRVLVIRDQAQVQGLGEGPGNCGVNVPFQDITVNNVAIDSHQDPVSGNVTFTPAVLEMEAGETEFWRVSNSTADTILDLQVLYDGVPQTLQIVGIDAVPVNSQDGTQPGSLIPVTDYRLAVAGRVEFLVQAPASTVKVAQLITNNINTGPQGDCDPTRPVFNIVSVSSRNVPPASVNPALNQGPSLERNALPASTGLVTHLNRFGGLRNATVSTTRNIQFSEIQPTQFFITVVGQTPTLFDNNNPPAVITTQGSVEHWNIQNIAQENHEFHQHQIHFLVLSQDNYETNGNPHNAAMNGQFADMVEVPYWDNVANPNGPVPTAELLMDFRGPDIGDFVYHCHILSHEDLGMMAIERVCPSTGCTH